VSCLLTNCICACYNRQRVNNEKISASSFYPGRGDNTHPLAHLDHASGNYTFHTPEVDDDGSETEDDSIDDGHTAELALRHPNKFSEAMVIEVSLPVTLNINY
jgi:hypothetical protein